MYDHDVVRDVESHSEGQKKHSRGAFLGEEFEFFFLNGAFWCTLYF